MSIINNCSAYEQAIDCCQAHNRMEYVRFSWNEIGINRLNVLFEFDHRIRSI